MSPALIILFSFILAATSMGGLLFVLFLPRISGQRLAQRRRELALGQRDVAITRGGGRGTGDDRPMRRSIEETLRELEQKSRMQRDGSVRASLKNRLRRAGLGWSALTYRSLGPGIGLALAMVLSAGLGMGAPASVVIGLAVGLWLPHAYVNSLIKRRRNAFTAAFPDAVDIIVRGVRAGIPLVDCLKIVATDSKDPVRSEFRALVEDLTMGLAVEEGVQRMSDRVNLEESRFFAIVITIQSRTGGNLSEALGNLSVVLRDRAKMRLKIKAMSSEAKASAGIIGSLPPIVAFLVFLTSPEYIGLLFTTMAGNFVLAGCALWMTCGILIMRAMINFDF